MIDAPAVALEDVSFHIRKGEVLGVVGESGSGKTTLGRILARIISPTKGSVTYAKEFSRPGADIQMVFQNPYDAFNPRMSIKESLREPLVVNRMTEGTDAKICTVLSILGLTQDMLRRMPRAFSGGQLQRLALARALVTSPKLLICDEPTSSLDLSVQAQIMNLFLTLRTPERAMLFISHNLQLVRIISDRIMVMYSGIILELADTCSLWKNPLHPYTKLLMDPDLIQTKKAARRSHKGKCCLFYSRCAQAGPGCEQNRPVLREVKPGHWVACFLS
jgi:oligopeptide/dipeptide ABC transporter ATP-binding protein